MSGSAAEREIRDYAARRLREMIPGARIIHELVVGGCRADLGAVDAERVTLVEIKSSKDTLSRLERQIRHFERAAHGVIVVADEKWFDRTPYDNGKPRFIPSKPLSDVLGYRHKLWAFPENAERKMYGPWSLSRPWSPQAEPRAADLLGLLWKQELLAEASRHQISAGSRSTISQLVRDMAWMMTGREIARAVCRQLRMRHFPEADVAMFESLAA